MAAAAKDAAILDVACGGGRVLHFLKQRGYEDLTGVDICAEQVVLSRCVVENVFEGDAVEFVKGTTRSYDVIIAFDFIEHLHKAEVFRFLTASFAKLRPGGRLIVKTPNANSYRGLGVFYGDFTRETCFTAGGLARVFSIIGFSETEVRQSRPVVHGIVSATRSVAWQVIRLGIMLRNIIE